MSNTLAQDEQAFRDRLMAAIANDYLGIKSLTPQGRDSLDFHDVGVTGLRHALLRAYELGLQRGKES